MSKSSILAYLCMCFRFSLSFSLLSLCLHALCVSLSVYITKTLPVLQSIFPVSYLIRRHIRGRKQRNSCFHFTNRESETGKLNHVLGYSDKKMVIGMWEEASQDASCSAIRRKPRQPDSWENCHNQRTLFTLPLSAKEWVWGSCSQGPVKPASGVMD